MNDILSVQGREKVQRPSLRLIVLRLSSFTIAAWVEFILWTSVLPHIARIESHLLDFTSAFSLIWWISHVSIVTSFITWSILTSCLSLITRLLSQKNPIQYHQGRKRAVPMSRPSRRKNQPESIDNNHKGDLPDYQTLRKRWAHCSLEDKANKTFVICLACNIPLCLVKEINCHQKHHI